MVPLRRLAPLIVSLAFISGCAAPGAEPLIIPDNVPHATVFLSAPFPYTELYLRGPLECTSFLGLPHKSRGGTRLVDIPKYGRDEAKQQARVPVGDHITFGVVQPERATNQYSQLDWTMSVEAGATYTVRVEPIQHLVIFFSGFNVTVTKDGVPVPIRMLPVPIKSNCPEDLS